jgi:hypothetical protein
MNCWRLNRERVLVQDVPLAIGMLVYCVSVDRRIDKLRVGGLARHDRWCAGHRSMYIQGDTYAEFDSRHTYISRETAIFACQLRMTEGESSSFWARIEGKHDPEGCWTWVGEKALNGVGVFRWRDWTYTPYEVVFDLRRIGREGIITHACSTRFCCNPKHMERK